MSVCLRLLKMIHEDPSVAWPRRPGDFELRVRPELYAAILRDRPHSGPYLYEDTLGSVAVRMDGGLPPGTAWALYDRVEGVIVRLGREDVAGRSGVEPPTNA